MARLVYQDDIEFILSKQQANGGECWASDDGRLGVGTPFSTLESLLILHELRLPKSHQAIKSGLRLLQAAQREDGRYRLAPKGAIYPCHTANCARVLCRFGLVGSSGMKRTFEHLLAIQHTDGGWHCRKFSGGRGPETEFSNPGVTLWVLDAFRFSKQLNKNEDLNRAVESLLNHWEVRRPVGPCHFGIGTLFMQVEYPFLRYNLFYYVYVLSYFERAKRDKRFLEAVKMLESKLDDRGRMVVERPHRQLAKLRFCAKGEASPPATVRYREILTNLKVT